MNVIYLYGLALGCYLLGWASHWATVPEVVGIVNGPELRERWPWDAVVLSVLSVINWELWT